MRNGLLSCLAVTLLACEEPVPDPPGEVVFVGDFIELRVTENAPEYCEGVPEYLDRYTEGLYDELKVIPDGGSVSYSIVHPDDVEYDGKVFRAFSSAEGIITGTPVTEHELVHAVHRKGYGRQYLLTEGLAEFFGGDALTDPRTRTGASAEELVGHVEEEGLLRGWAYGDAGRFVSYLDRFFGREILLDLLDNTSRDDVSVEDFTSKVEDVTEMNWGDIARGYDDSEVCDQYEYWNASAVCRFAEPLSLCDEGEEKWNLIDLDCGASGVLGEREDFTGEGGPEIWTYRAVTLQPGRYWMSIRALWEAESVGYVSLKNCDGGCGSFLQRFSVPVGGAGATPFDIEVAGDYLVKIARPLEAMSDVEFQILGACE